MPKQFEVKRLKLNRDIIKKQATRVDLITKKGSPNSLPPNKILGNRKGQIRSELDFDHHFAFLTYFLKK